jgi:multidrug efflux pump subunit AcrA (membrane-fusion protein)
VAGVEWRDADRATRHSPLANRHPMSRRRKQRGVPVSLFPFLSVLACVIGVLTLLITAMALGQLNPNAIAQAEAYQQARQQADQAQQQIARLTELAAQAQAAQEKIDLANAEVARLRQKNDAVEKQRSDQAALEAEADRLRQEVPELQAELRRRQQQVPKLEAALAQKKGLKPEAKVRVQPSGSGVGFKPVFVECQAEGIIIHDGPAPVAVRRNELGSAPAFLALLQRVADDEKATVVFLLRDNGVGTYQIASAVARANYARNGKLPLVGHGELDLSLFKNQK